MNKINSIQLESLILAQNERWRRGLGMQVVRSIESGKRVSNAWVICPRVGNNPAKAGLIPNKTTGTYVPGVKAGDSARGPALEDKPASYQLVGEVTAHQGY